MDLLLACLRRGWKGSSLHTTAFNGDDEFLDVIGSALRDQLDEAETSASPAVLDSLLLLALTFAGQITSLTAEKPTTGSVGSTAEVKSARKARIRASPRTRNNTPQLGRQMSASSSGAVCLLDTMSSELVQLEAKVAEMDASLTVDTGPSGSSQLVLAREEGREEEEKRRQERYSRYSQRSHTK